MEQPQLKLKVGDSLQLQTRDSDENNRRMQVQVIGYLPGQSLLVTTPRVNGNVLLIREGQPYVVRMMAGNSVIGFTTQVIRNCARPYPYLHLSYPQEMEQIVVRAAQRITVKLFASLKNDNPDFQFIKPHGATIVDLSTSGALLVSDEQLGEVGDQVVLTCAFKVGDAEKLLAIPALLRNVQIEDPDEFADQKSFQHGLEFNLQEENDTMALHGYVYQEIVKATME